MRLCGLLVLSLTMTHLMISTAYAWVDRFPVDYFTNSPSGARINGRNAYCGLVADFNFSAGSGRNPVDLAILQFEGEATGYWIDALTQVPNTFTTQVLQFRGEVPQQNNEGRTDSWFRRQRQRTNQIERGIFVSIGIRLREAKAAGQRVCIAYPESEAMAAAPIPVTKVRVGYESNKIDGQGISEQERDLAILRKILGEP